MANTFKISNHSHPTITERVAKAALALGEKFIEDLSYREAKSLEGRSLDVVDDGTVTIEHGRVVGKLDLKKVERVYHRHCYECDGGIETDQVLCLLEEVVEIERDSILAIQKEIAQLRSLLEKRPTICRGWRNGDGEWDEELDICRNFVLLEGIEINGVISWTRETPVDGERWDLENSGKEAVSSGERWLGEVE